MPLLLRTMCLLLISATSLHAEHFYAARPIWPEGRELEMNLNVWFGAEFDWDNHDAPPVLRLAACTTYRAYLNGYFVGYGPARGPHGYFRLDEWQLGDHSLISGHNRIIIEVAGYAANSFALLDGASFLQAEIVSDGKVLAATGAVSAFQAHVMSERLQKAQRYSFQRPFSEVYRFAGGKSAAYRLDSASEEPLKCAVRPEVKLLPHRVPYPQFSVRPAVQNVAEGTLEPGQPVKDFFKDRSLTQISDALKGYREADLQAIPSLDLQKVKTVPKNNLDGPPQAARLITNSYRIVDLGTNLTGFVGCTIRSEGKARFYVVFDEILSNGDVDFKRLGCVNIIQVDMAEAGTYQLESFEPYTMRYVKLLVLEGTCEVSNVYLRELTAPDVWQASFSCSDPRLNRLFEAGRETFRQNALDVFMDCPSRERAGWLCDSFFTSRVAVDLSGHAKIEHNFYENFLLPDRYPKIPDGMLPMCYPSDHYDGVFIPNWAMWFVVQMEEYLARSGDRATVDALKPKVLKLIEFLDKYRNSDGLLEKLPSWVFVEWSAANGFVQDVNYPSNALYAGVLDAAGHVYGIKDLNDRAEAIRETIRKQAFDGKWFVDNAMRKGDRLEVTKNHTETSQYYQFFFGVATPERYGELWKAITEQFGPKRMQKGLYPDVPPSNSFVGNMLRMEILSRYGRSQQILDESIDYLMYMADRTGTLWENMSPEASCNHGFASHIVHTLYRDILGVRRLESGRAQIRFAPLKLDWCEGRIPTPHGFLTVRWTRQGDELSYRIEAPPGCKVDVSASEPLKLKRMP